MDSGPVLAVAAALACLLGLGGLQTAAAAPAERGCAVVVTIPAIDVREDLVYYQGSPDDRRGTRIQDTGALASPQGPDGGVRAGEVGNHFIAGHRTSAGGPLLKVRQLHRGDVVRIRTRCASGSDITHTYTVAGRARYIDFFTRAGRADQIAPVPFRRGVEPTQAMVTLSTCATQEDNARGDRRRDRFGNPPGRWVVVGILTTSLTR